MRPTNREPPDGLPIVIQRIKDSGEELRLRVVRRVNSVARVLGDISSSAVEHVERRVRQATGAARAIPAVLHSLALRLRQRLSQVAEAVLLAPGRVYAALISLCRRASEKIKFAAITLLKLLALAFYLTPRWVVLELPGRVRLLIGSLTRTIRTFVVAEVVPTSEFFVEVPPRLAAAALRDLGFRLPVWSAVESSRISLRIGRWTLYGFLRPIAKEILSMGRWLVVQSRRLAITSYKVLIWFVRGIRNLPQLLKQGIQCLRQWLAGVLRQLIARLYAMVRLLLRLVDGFIATIRRIAVWFAIDLPDLMRRLCLWLVEQGVSLVRGLVNAVRKTAWFLFVDLPRWLSRALWTLAERMVKFCRTAVVWAVQFTSKAVRVLFVELPLWFWRLLKAFAREAVSFAREVASAIRSAAYWLLVQLPRAILRFLTQLPLRAYRLLLEVYGRLIWLLADFIPGVFRALWQFAMLFAIRLPRSLWRLATELIANLFAALRRIAAIVKPHIVRGLSIAANGLTWSLAIVITPFYMLWRLSRSIVGRA